MNAPDLRPPSMRPRIIQTEDTGRLDLSVAPAPERRAIPAARRTPLSPFAVAAGGIGILVVGVVAINLAEFVGGAFDHGTAWGVVAATAVAAGAGGALY